jgi:hypothetical protein
MSGGNEPPAGTVVAIALRICREHWPTLAVYGLLAGVPVAALDAANALARGVDPFATPLTGVTDATAGGASTVSSVLALVLYAVASAATVHTVAAARDGRRTGWQEGLGAGIRRVGGVVAASIIVLALVLLGLLALVLPGIWIAVALALTTPALVLERLPALAAVRRSFTMVQGALVADGRRGGTDLPRRLRRRGGRLHTRRRPRRGHGGPSLRALIAGVANALSTALWCPLTVGPMTVLFLARRPPTAVSRTEEDAPATGLLASRGPRARRRPRVGGTPSTAPHASRIAGRHRPPPSSRHGASRRLRADPQLTRRCRRAARRKAPERPARRAPRAAARWAAPRRPPHTPAARRAARCARSRPW